MISAAAAAQLKLWYQLSPPLNPAVNFFSNPDMLNLVIPERISMPDNRLRAFMLGYLGLFSSCKSIRAHVWLLIEAVKKMFIPWYVQPISPFYWGLMEGLPVGEFMLLLRNYSERGPIRHVHFPSPLPQIVSMTPPQDLARPIQGFVVSSMINWNMPLSPVVNAFAEMLVRYQVDGDLSELHVFGFFSSATNRRCFENMVSIIELPELRDLWVHCDHRLTLLKLLIERSYAVIDFTPKSQGEWTVPDERMLEYLPRITGVHVGVNPRDIAPLNIYSEGRGPGISFRMLE